MQQLKASKKFVAAVLATALGLFAASAAHSQLFASEKEIMRQARLEWLNMKRHLPLAPNPRVQRYVECVAYSIIDVLDDSYDQLDWEVVVFDDEAVNAFAMPGGKVGVFTGILRVADTPDALGAVLGHEIAHLTEDHVMERARRQKRNDALVLLGGAATGMRGIMQDGATIFLSLPFGRKQESDADLVGLDYMAKAGFDPRASIYLWKNMAAQRQGQPPEFLSTHPSDDKRLDDLVGSLAPALVAYNGALNEGRRPSCQP